MSEFPKFGTDDEQDVGGICGSDHRCSAHPGTQRERMVLVDGPLAVDGGGDRGRQPLGDGEQFHPRSAGTPSCDDHRSSGSRKTPCGINDQVGGSRCGRGMVCRRHGGVTDGVEQVEGNLEVDRSRAS